MTNNPQKIEAIQTAGFRIRQRLAADVPATVDSARYLTTKRDRLGHLYGGETERSFNQSGTDHEYGVGQGDLCSASEYPSVSVDEG